VPRLDRDDQTAALARKSAEKGLITLQQQRSPASRGAYDYIAKRTHLSVIAAAPPPPREDSLSPELRLLLDHLSRRADQGAPCLSNRGIARACGLKDAEAARYRLRQLRSAGAIIVAPVPVEPGRVITIVETGARTGFIRPAQPFDRRINSYETGGNSHRRRRRRAPLCPLGLPGAATVDRALCRAAQRGGGLSRRPARAGGA
jgi:hypothetical protein